jgi:hypothetical protein
MVDNQLIAEFMGVEKENGLYLFTTPMDDYKTDTLYFDTSWDWLMPVVEKIEFLEEVDDDMSWRGLCTLEGTYNNVVEFIKEYNNEQNTIKRSDPLVD